MTADIKDFILEGSDEFFFKYNLYNDIHCIETSLHKDLVDEIFNFIDYNSEVELPSGYVWVAYTSKFCEEFYNDKNMINLAIESDKLVERFDKVGYGLLRKSRGLHEARK